MCPRVTVIPFTFRPLRGIVANPTRPGSLIRHFPSTATAPASLIPHFPVLLDFMCYSYPCPLSLLLAGEDDQGATVPIVLVAPVDAVLCPFSPFVLIGFMDRCL